MKERINYWILLAQLNPIPVAVGVVVLLLLIGLFLFQRRRARAPRTTRSTASKSKRATTKSESGTSVRPEASAASSSAVPAVVVPAVVAAATPADADREQEKPPARAAETASMVEPAAADDPRRERISKVNEEARKLTNGAAFDESLIGSDDPETRKIVGAELLAAIVGRNATRRENARAAFIKHGYFDDATRDLRVADSENERAAAARRLSFVHDHEATPHLVGALGDASPDVRRAAVEALMDLRDPAAIPALNSLMQTENDRKVPRTLIKQAIEACATAAPAEPASAAAPPNPMDIPDPASHPVETEREVIEL